MASTCNVVATTATGSTASWLQQASQITIGQCTPYQSGNTYNSATQFSTNGNLWQIGSTQAIAYTVTSTSGTVASASYVSIIAYVTTASNTCSGSIAYIKTFMNPTTSSCLTNLDGVQAINIYQTSNAYSPVSGATSTGVVVNT